MAPESSTPSRRPPRVRSIVHGTCLLNGHHPPGSDLARECPVHRAARRSEAQRGAWKRRNVKTGTPPQPDPGNRL